MKIGSIQKFSMIDFPGQLSAVIFTQGCNFRCPYCHNPELVDPHKFSKPIPVEEIFSFLQTRVGKLDGVVITGGEPTLHSDLIDFISKVRLLGFLIKLDTNGSNPEMLKEIIKFNLVDYIAMDYKAPLSKYSDVIRSNINLYDILESVEIIKNSKIKYEFRTTVVEKLLSPWDIHRIQNEIGDAEKYCIQNFVASKTLDESFMKYQSFSSESFENLDNNYTHQLSKRIIR